VRKRSFRPTLKLQGASHRGGVVRFVGVGAQGAHGGSLARAHEADVRQRAVDGDAHLPAQRVNLAHQVPLGGSADRAVAGHVRRALQVQRDDRCATAHPRRRQRRLTPRMPRPHHKYLKVRHQGELYPSAVGSSPSSAESSPSTPGTSPSSAESSPSTPGTSPSSAESSPSTPGTSQRTPGSSLSTPGTSPSMQETPTGSQLPKVSRRALGLPRGLPR
jgi:hypothetical protein